MTAGDDAGPTGARETRHALADEIATADLGRRIARSLREGDVIALSGGLGAGKTTLARAIIAGLGHVAEVPSPSFAIIQTYDPPDVSIPLVHADFYRLDDPAEAHELGLDDYREGAAMIAEWPEKAGGFDAEAGCLAIEIQMAGDSGADMRIAIARAGADWLERWP